MGRADHLTRLALGRSAFRPLEPSTSSEPSHESSETSLLSTNEINESIPSQQYDAKGRPTSEAANRLNAELRHAQNEVLELVNIVERRRSTEETDHLMDLQRDQQRLRSDKLADELDDFVDEAIVMLTWYPETLMHRYLSGVYDAAAPLAQLVASDVNSAVKGSWENAENIFFPGLGYTAVAMAATALPDLIDVVMILVDRRLRKKEMGKKSDIVLNVGRFALNAARACTLPLQHLAVAARLGFIQPNGVRSTLTLLAGYYALCSTPQSLFILSTTAVLSSMIGKQSMLDMLWHRASIPTRRSELKAIPAPQTTGLRASSRLTASQHSQTASSLRRTFKPSNTAGCTSRSLLTWTRSLLFTGNAILRRLAHLPVDFLVLQCSARIFDCTIFGPDWHTASMSNALLMPNSHPGLPLFGLASHVNTEQCLYATGKIGLALGLSLGIDAALRCLYMAFKRHCINDFSDEDQSLASGK